MSVYKPKGSPFYHYDFQRRGIRFCGSTERTSRRDAEAVERAEREKAKVTVAEAKAAAASVELRDVAFRYWTEIGQHHSGASDTFRDLARLVKHFGETKRLTEITDSDVAAMVAWRRQHRIYRGKKAGPLISNSTVNRSTTEVLKKLFTRAKRAWRVRFDAEPDWKAHMLEEAGERVRELQGDESELLEAATRDDYLPFFDFVRASGLRRRECLLKWSEVNWETGLISKKGKGGKLVTAPITPTVRAILWPLRGHHKVFVFTYVAMRAGPKYAKGDRLPITNSGAKTVWRRLRAKAGVTDFRFHDFRHDLATKLLRQTGNLKLVQRALNHADIKTTTRYAHVLTDEVAQALQTVSKSRKKSRIVRQSVS